MRRMMVMTKVLDSTVVSPYRIHMIHHYKVSLRGLTISTL
jgi:hypothetical protein